jgi:hypothetical protein
VDRDSADDDDERPGWSTDLHPAAAEPRKSEAGHDRRESPAAGGEIRAEAATSPRIDAMPKAMASGKAIMPTVIPATRSRTNFWPL